ncbi:MAG: hypothetical protein AAF747_11775 [Planctomycetota bacterium]
MNTNAAIVVLACAGVASAQPMLTDLFQFSANSTGNASGGQIWDTRSGGTFAIWISANGTPINGVSSLTAAEINYPLTAGVHEFRMWGQPGSVLPFFAANLFFDGSTTPGISAFAATTTSVSTTPPTQTNFATSTLGPVGSPAAAGTLTFTSGTFTVTLSDYFYAIPSVFGEDVGTSSTRTPGGGADFVGGFTLTVVPAPASAALLGGVGLLAIRRRR